MALRIIGRVAWRRIALVALALMACTGCSTGEPAPTSTPTPLSRGPIYSQTGCPASPIQAVPFDVQPRIERLPWIIADPAAAGITAHLFYPHAKVSSDGSTTEYRYLYTEGHMPDGTATKMFWDIQNPAAGSELQISGMKLNGAHDSFQQVFPRALSPVTNYPSIVSVPSPGCWQLTLKSGSVHGTMVFWVVSA